MSDKPSNEIVTVLSEHELDEVAGGGYFSNYQSAGCYNVNTNIAQNNTVNCVSFNVG